MPKYTKNTWIINGVFRQNSIYAPDKIESTLPPYTLEIANIHPVMSPIMIDNTEIVIVKNKPLVLY